MQALGNPLSVSQLLEVRANKRKEWEAQFEANKEELIKKLSSRLFSEFSADIRGCLANPFECELTHIRGFSESIHFPLFDGKTDFDLTQIIASLAPFKERRHDFYEVNKKGRFTKYTSIGRDIFRPHMKWGAFIGEQVAKVVQNEFAKDKSLEDLEIRVIDKTKGYTSESWGDIIIQIETWLKIFPPEPPSLSSYQGGGGGGY